METRYKVYQRDNGIYYIQDAPLVARNQAVAQPALSVTMAKVYLSGRSLDHRQGFTEITLHGYRYAWARRAKSFGMPLREAMAHLGHGSKAVHQAYSESAEIVTLPLEFYEKQHRDKIPTVYRQSGKKSGHCGRRTTMKFRARIYPARFTIRP